MPYDDGLAHRIRTILQKRVEVDEREMFGGVGYMLNGNLVCGVQGDALIARVGPDAYETALEKPHAREMDFTGTPMRGFVFVDPAGTASKEALEAWVDRCLDFVNTLPEKPKRK